MQKTLSVKEAATLADVHSTEVYAAIYGNKLRVVPNTKPYQILAESFAAYKRIKDTKRALAREERQLVSPVGAMP